MQVAYSSSLCNAQLLLLLKCLNRANTDLETRHRVVISAEWSRWDFGRGTSKWHSSALQLLWPQTGARWHAQTEWCHRSWRTQLPSSKSSPRRQALEVRLCYSVNRGKGKGLVLLPCHKLRVTLLPPKAPGFLNKKKFGMNNTLIWKHTATLKRLASPDLAYPLELQAGFDHWTHYRLHGTKPRFCSFNCVSKQTVITSGHKVLLKPT